MGLWNIANNDQNVYYEHEIIALILTLKSSYLLQSVSIALASIFFGIRENLHCGSEEGLPVSSTFPPILFCACTVCLRSDKISISGATATLSACCSETTVSTTFDIDDCAVVNED